MKQYQATIEDCDEALDIAPDNPKALFRKGQALHGLGDYENSFKVLNQAIKLAPNDKAIHSELAAVRGEIQAYKAKERQVYSKLFS